VPIILYQFWAFVAPGLYKSERRLVLPLLVASTLLFYLGVVFAYFVVFPLVFGFLTTTAPVGVTVMTDITKYLDFILTMFFAFGVCFEVPIFTIVLVWTGFTTPAELADKRPYVIVGAFIIGMLLTPPDAISQTLLAVPMWMLFEIGLVCSRFFVHSPERGDNYPQVIEDHEADL
jgi:sec-independent protein translocase protein TatC